MLSKKKKRERKKDIPSDPAILCLGLTKGNEIRISKRYLHSQVYYSITHNSQGVETKCSSVDEGVKKMRYMYTIECYSDTK